jgi:hypothetical protein
MLNGTMTRATYLATPLRDKLHGKLHRVTGPLNSASKPQSQLITLRMQMTLLMWMPIA